TLRRSGWGGFATQRGASPLTTEPQQVLEPLHIFYPAPTVVTSDEIGTMAPLAERQASLW
ncbi:hypothetical protein, partial [Pseudomonas sp. SWRI 103]|uniref:hypothetical protein n=1 Tax=Pseudomonas sp. SWRI 103 TaxID=2725411 RepID=UPI001C498D76